MQIDLEKIKKLPPDVRKDFYKMYLKYGEKKKQTLAQENFLNFVKHMWPEFIEGPHHKIVAKKFAPASPRFARLRSHIINRGTKSILNFAHGAIYNNH